MYRRLVLTGLVAAVVLAVTTAFAAPNNHNVGALGAGSNGTGSGSTSAAPQGHAGDPRVTVVNTTQLLFITPGGSRSVPTGSITIVANIDVHAFRQVRVSFDNRCGSPTSVTFDVTQREGLILIGQLDSVTLAPCGNFSRVYDVPGTGLVLQTDQRSVSAGSTDFVDAVIYGHD